jgi:hypothetical protein
LADVQKQQWQSFFEQLEEQGDIGELYSRIAEVALKDKDFMSLLASEAIAQLISSDEKHMSRVNIGYSLCSFYRPSLLWIL